MVLGWSNDLMYIILTQFVHVTHFHQSQRSMLKRAQIAGTNVPRDAPKEHAQTLGQEREILPHT